MVQQRSEGRGKGVWRIPPHLGKCTEAPATRAIMASHAEAGTKAKRVVAVFLVGQAPRPPSSQEHPEAPAEGRHGAGPAEQSGLKPRCVFRPPGGHLPAPEEDH